MDFYITTYYFWRVEHQRRNSMKKLLAFILLTCCGACVFAQHKYSINWYELMDSTHKDIITRFGTPDMILSGDKCSVEIKPDYDNYYYYSGSYADRKEEVDKYTSSGKSKDIIFHYDAGMDLTFDTSSGKLYLCGMKFFANSTQFKNLPYGLTLSDKLIDIFTKLGNPDEYSKSLIVYNIPFAYQGNNIRTSSYPEWIEYDYSASEIIKIYWTNDTITAIEITRIQNITVDYDGGYGK